VLYTVPTGKVFYLYHFDFNNLRWGAGATSCSLYFYDGTTSYVIAMISYDEPDGGSHTQGQFTMMKIPEGWAERAEILRKELESILPDHDDLNKALGSLEPTSENFAAWIYKKYRERFPERPLLAVEVAESPKFRALYCPHARLDLLLAILRSHGGEGSSA